MPDINNSLFLQGGSRISAVLSYYYRLGHRSALQYLISHLEIWRQAGWMMEVCAASAFFFFFFIGHPPDPQSLDQHCSAWCSPLRRHHDTTWNAVESCGRIRQPSTVEARHHALPAGSWSNPYLGGEPARGQATVVTVKVLVHDRI